MMCMHCKGNDACTIKLMCCKYNTIFATNGAPYATTIYVTQTHTHPTNLTKIGSGHHIRLVTLETVNRVSVRKVFSSNKRLNDCPIFQTKGNNFGWFLVTCNNSNIILHNIII